MKKKLKVGYRTELFKDLKTTEIEIPNEILGKLRKGLGIIRNHVKDFALEFTVPIEELGGSYKVGNVSIVTFHIKENIYCTFLGNDASEYFETELFRV